jgi:hypothetical protein
MEINGEQKKMETAREELPRVEGTIGPGALRGRRR